MSLFLGLDVGTQGTKAVVVDAQAHAVVGRGAVAYGLIAGLPPGAAEQHPATWIDAVRNAAAQALAELDASRVAAVGVSGQQHGLVVLDDENEVVRPAKLWCDTSTAAEARELGVPTGFTASKALWMQRHEPENWARVRHVLLPHDYVNLRLTGARTMEAGDASGTGVFDVVARDFDRARLAALDLEGKVPAILPPGAPAGRLTDDGAKLLGLQAGIPVAAGGGDNMMSAVGSGATRPGTVVVSLGTSGTVFTYSAAPVIDAAGLIAPFCDSTGGWLPLLCVMNATGVLEEVASATDHDHNELTEAARDVEPGSEGVMWLPYLQGERVPDLPDATGTLLGLRPGTLDPAVLYRAAIEGTSLNIAWGVQRMRELGIAVEAVRAAGGGARNPLWRSVLADALDAPVSLLAEPESAALGAAICALWTTGGEVDALAEPFVRLDGEVVEPRRADVYRDLLARFRERVGAIYG